MSDDSSKPLDTGGRPSDTAFRAAMLSMFTVVFLYFFAQIAGGFVVSLSGALIHTSANLQDSVGMQFFYGLIVDAILILGVAGMLKWMGWGWGSIGLKRPKAYHIGYGAFAVIPYYIFLYGAVAILTKLIPALDVAQKQDLGFASVDGTLSIVLAFISLVILPPLVEEIMMRGFLYTGLKKWLPKVIAAVIVSALFGAAHLAEGGSGGPLWIGAIDTFTLSLFLVGLREMTGNLWAGITLHALKNGLAFVPFLVMHLH